MSKETSHWRMTHVQEDPPNSARKRLLEEDVIWSKLVMQP